MGEYLIYIGVALVGFGLGWKLKGFMFLAIMSQEPEKIMKILQKIKEINEQESRLGQPVMENMVEVDLEAVGSTFYAYAKNNGQFLAQGTSIDDVLIQASKRFPHMTFWHDNSKQSSQTA